MSKKKLSDTRLLQIAEMKSLCNWGEERLKDLHYKFTVLLDEGTDEEIEDFAKKAQPFFLFLKNTLDDENKSSESWVGMSTKRVLEYYEKEKEDISFNRLDQLFRKEGSKLQNFIYVK